MNILVTLLGAILGGFLGLAWREVEQFVGQNSLWLILGVSLLALIWVSLVILGNLIAWQKVEKKSIWRLIFSILSATFMPLAYLFSFPSRETSYRCPRCSSKDAYATSVTRTTGAVGTVIDSPNGPDFGVVQQVGYNETIMRCRKCNTDVLVFESRRFRRWANTWWFLFGFASLFIGARLLVEFFF
jgi:hypothetical protein